MRPARVFWAARNLEEAEGKVLARRTGSGYEAARRGKAACYQQKLAAIERYTFSALEAVEFDCGAAHAELMITHDGLHLIEINPRLVGAKMGRIYR